MFQSPWNRFYLVFLARFKEPGSRAGLTFIVKDREPSNFQLRSEYGALISI